MAYFETHVLDNQIKALDTIGTASGAICTFDTDRAERLVKCVCEVASGNSEINVVACGKNLFDINALTASGITISGNTAEGSAVSFASAFGSNIPVVLPNTQIVIGITGYTDGNQGTSGNGLRIRLKYTDTTETILTFSNNDTTAIRKTILSDNAKTIDKIYIDYGSNGNNIWHLSDIQIEIGGTASEFTAYNGNTYNIPFGETLSDTATYDAISGILTRNDSTTKQLDSCNIVALDNETNNVYCDTGDTEVNYILTVGQAIS